MVAIQAFQKLLFEEVLLQKINFTRWTNTQLQNDKWPLTAKKKLKSRGSQDQFNYEQNHTESHVIGDILFRNQFQILFCMFFWGLHWWNHFDSILWRQRKQSYYTLEIIEIRNPGILALIENFHKVKKNVKFVYRTWKLQPPSYPLEWRPYSQMWRIGKPLSENFPAGMNMELQTQTPRSIFRTFCFTMDEIFCKLGLASKEGYFYCTFAMKRHRFETNTKYPFLAS